MRRLLSTFAFLLLPFAAHASIVDALNLSPVVPLVLDALMTVATGGYEFFVGNGDGIIYVVVWGWLGISLAMYLVKMYLPKNWLGFFGFSNGGEMWEGKTTGFQIGENMLKPTIRATIAALVLLQIKPVYLTEWVIDPFLRLGAIYTEAITSGISNQQLGISNQQSAISIECPPDIVQKAWISEDACTFMLRPVDTISRANNQMIKRGFEFINRGLLSLMTVIPHGENGFLNLITGIMLVSTFVGLNFFMALLVIQAIFTFGMSLILYPFKVLIWVVKPSDPDAWVDLWPPFDGIIKALQGLIITMISCAFILTINIAVARALFNWNNSVFVVAAGGTSVSNVPTVANGATSFGEHSILWLSAILTFYLMQRIFTMTREQITKYAGNDKTKLYDQVKKDATTTKKNVTDWGKKILKVFKK